MSYSFKLSRRISRLRLPVCVAFASLFAACNGDGTLDPNSVAAAPAVPTSVGNDAGVDTLAVTTDGVTASAVGGMPFGNMAQPVTMFGSLYSGGKITTGPSNLRTELATIKSRGGRVIVMLAGSPVNYKDAAGHFSLTKWKQRIDRYRGINFGSYITDGTIIGHFLLDEPQDPTNWKGVPVTPATVDQMGQYSKQIWPGMATIIRVKPSYFKSNPHYVDAAWAQYVSWYGSPTTYVNQQVSDAKARGLALILGMNVIDGGSPKHTEMSASEVKSYGAALMANSYACAFVNWQYRSTYFGSSGIKDAMQYLRSKAGSHSFKSCKGS
ncbi:MAG: hypothetical protein ACTHM9_03210 [Gemmatimonadales bacterium]